MKHLNRSRAAAQRHAYGLVSLTVVLASSTVMPASAGDMAAAQRRAQQAVAQMTLEEKASQMLNQVPPIQRLGLPAYNFWNESLHGVVAFSRNTTAYPEPIGLAATFNPALLHQVAQQIAREGRAHHEASRLPDGSIYGPFQGPNYFSPNLNLFRDPRWGRGQETYGEDPYLIGRMGVAYIRGMQSEGLASATAKHLAVHSGPEPLRHHFDAKVSAHDLHDTYLPAFREAVVAGGVDSVMCVYNAINGVPGCAHDELLNGIVRRAWGFKGAIVSDCDALRDIHTRHRYVSTAAQAVAAAVKGGTDLECFFGAPTAANDYVEAVRQGLLSTADLDRAVTRSLALRYALGLVSPRKAPDLPLSVIDSAAHRATALQAARESLVLLKNTGVLPLRKDAAPRIAVVGPLADDVDALLGNYNATPSAVSTPLAALRQRLGDDRVTWQRGADFPLAVTSLPDAVLTTPTGQPGLLMEAFKGDTATGEPEVSHTVRNVAWKGTPGQGLVRFTGWLTPTQGGDYLLGGNGTGGARYYLDDQLVTDDSAMHQPQEKMGAVHLEAGRRYRLLVEHVPNPFGFSRIVWFRRDPQRIEAAVAAARQADVVVAMVGITAKLEGEEMVAEAPGFLGGDRSSLDLPEEEQRLLEAVKATGKPLVVVLMSGSALSVNWAAEHADALVQAWYAGQAGGEAIADVLLGDHNPSARLPVTFYTGLAQLPSFEDYAMKARTYRYFEGRPLFPFGYGLSYTKFSYQAPVLSRARLRAGQPLQASVLVRNDGPRDGDEVVQAYLQFPANTPGAPRLALRGFAKVHLKTGESRRVTLRFSDRDLSHVGADGRRWVGAKGEYRLSLGGGQPATQALSVTRTFRIEGQRSLPQ